MLFLGLLLLGGVAYRLVERMLPAVAVGLILFPVLLAAFWFNDRTGVEDLVVHSWQLLSGVDTPGEIVVDCPTRTDSTREEALVGLLVSLLGLALALGNVFVALVALIGIPVGLVGSVVGGIHALITRRSTWLSPALSILLAGIGAVVVAGLVMRLMHWLSGLNC